MSILKEKNLPVLPEEIFGRMVAKIRVMLVARGKEFAAVKVTGYNSAEIELYSGQPDPTVMDSTFVVHQHGIMFQRPFALDARLKADFDLVQPQNPSKN